VAELKQANVEAEPVTFPYDTTAARQSEVKKRGDRLQLLSYLRAASWQNLKGSRILRIASLAADCDWKVVGMDRDEVPAGEVVPSNLEFLGWVSDPLLHLEQCDIFIRLVGHDAYSGMVRDAQAMGKTVIYSMPVDDVICVSGMTDDAIVNILHDIGSGRGGLLNERADGPEGGRLVLSTFGEQIRRLADVVCKEDSA
jgi:hypothetical protein